MKSKFEIEKIAQQSPALRYDKAEYLKLLKSDLSKAKKESVPLLGMIVGKFPFGTGDVSKTEEYPLVVVGIDTKKDFKRLAKKLVVGKEDSLKKDVDIKTAASVEFTYDANENTMQVKFLKTKGMPAKILKLVNKKLKKYMQFELHSDEQSEVEEKFIEETGSDSKFSGISIDHIKKSLAAYRETVDKNQRLPIAKKIVEDTVAWLKEFEKRAKNKFIKKLSQADKDRQDYVLDLKAKFESQLMKIQLEKDMIAGSGLSEEDAEDWMNLYTEIKIEHDRYFLQNDLSLADFSLEERKDFLEDTLDDISKWQKLHADIRNINVNTISQEALAKEQKHVDKITTIDVKLKGELKAVNKQLEIDSALKGLRDDIALHRRICETTTDNAKKLVALRNLLHLSNELEAELQSYQ